MASPDFKYQCLVEHLLIEANEKPSRCGPVVSETGLQFKHDLREGFPLLQHKKVSLYNVAVELQWILKGKTDVKFLQEKGVHIWDKDAERSPYGGGDLGPIYGYQWRRADSGRYDQIANLIEMIKKDPFSRRLIVNSWNVPDIDLMVLPPCHYAFQIVAQNNAGDTKLDIEVSMRSTDIGLGLPYNIASYALLLELISRTVGMRAGKMIINMADAHIYKAHSEALMNRVSNFAGNKKVRLNLSEDKNLDWFVNADLTPELVNSMVKNYEPMGVLKLPLLVGPPSDEQVPRSDDQPNPDPIERID